MDSRLRARDNAGAPSDTEQLWIDLETNGWLTGGIGVRRARQAPIKSIRKSWTNLTEGQQIAIGALLTSYQQTQSDDLATVDAALPAEPDDDSDGEDRLDIYSTLLVRRRAIGNTIQSITQLRQGRMLHPDPYGTADWLLAQHTDFLAQDAATTALISSYWLTLLGPSGTPPASPNANGTPASALPMPPAPTTSWLGGWPLGGGGQSVPGVYVRQNRNGRIIDRVCVKDTEWPLPLPSSQWDPDFLPNTDDFDTKQPAEIGAFTTLNPCAGSDNIVRLRNWHRVRRNNSIASYRMYLEWCSLGDLYDLGRKYTPYRDLLDLPRPATQAEQDKLPEAFLWSCFENLANAGRLMETGSVDPLAPQQPWSQIVHADLKTQNVFLDNSNTSGIYAGYPQIKLGDFGVANIISYDDSRVLGSDEYGRGTEACQAPEQVDATQPVNEKTNIWGIGAIIWSLMNSTRTARPFYTPVGDPAVLTPTNPRDPTVTFSRDHVRPLARPNYSLMLQTIRRNTTPTAGVVDLAGGLRGASRDDERFQDDAHDLRLSEQSYPLYAALAQHCLDAPEPDKTTATLSSGAAGLFGPPGDDNGGIIDGS